MAFSLGTETRDKKSYANNGKKQATTSVGPADGRIRNGASVTALESRERAKEQSDVRYNLALYCYATALKMKLMKVSQDGKARASIRTLVQRGVSFSLGLQCGSRLTGRERDRAST